MSKITPTLIVLGSLVAVGLAAEGRAATFGEAVRCQRSILDSDVRRTRCLDLCERHGHGLYTGCEARCQAAFEQSIAKPLQCIEDRIIRHVRVPANAYAVDTGVDTPRHGDVSIVAVGSWSYIPTERKVTSMGKRNSHDYPNARNPNANLGELIMRSDPWSWRYSFPVGRPIPITHRDVTPERMYLSMNDLDWGFEDNTGFLDVSIMVDGATEVHVDVPANEWIDSKVFKAPDSYVAIGASGLWSNAGAPSLGPDGYSGYKYPGTMMPDGDLAALAGLVGDTFFQVGSAVGLGYPGVGPLHLGMNDVWNALSDNQGSMQVIIYNGLSPVL